MNTMPISRRRFTQLLGAGAACAIVKPAFSLAVEPAARSTSTSAVRLSSNENPYGPSPKAFKAMVDAFDLACRYPDEQNGLLIDAVAGPTRGKLVAADPTFEAILNNAAINGAEVVKVPLTSSFSHDLPKMSAAAKQGLIYICNPNNPTASITPKNEVREFIAKAPRQTMILVDEAYLHYADSPDYESAIPLIKDHPNLIVARTFSKIYGMAGLRCGYCVAQKETIERMRPHQMWDSVNIMALAAAIANLNDPDQVANGKRLNSEAKAFVSGKLDQMGYKQIPSQANFVMIDVIQALKQHNVQVGRLFPALPNHMRVTIGKKNEMESFLSAFRQVAA